MRRRRFLGLAGGGTLAAVAGVAVDNVLLGYGPIAGTNLLEQDVEAKVNERLGPHSGRTLEVAGTAVEVHADELRVGENGLGWDAQRDDVERTEREHGLPDGSLAQLVHDVPTLWEREHSVEAVEAGTFFDRASRGETRPYSVAALRGPRVREVRPAVVERFAGVDPADPRDVTYGLVDGFREHAFYDAPRYVAGALEDNVFRRHVDLRGPFASPTGFPALLSGGNDGLFCYDFAYRSIEAFHAVPAPEQTVPVVGAYVRDARHKHSYTGLATVLVGKGTATLLVTFLDYTPTTAAHDFGVTRAVGDDPNAYGAGHRTTDVYWNHRTYA